MTLCVDESARFPRVTAPVVFGTPMLAAMTPIGDVAFGGLRVRTPEALRVNEEHTVSLLLPSGRQLPCRVRVVWSGGGRRSGGHEAGLKIIGVASSLDEVWQVLEAHDEPVLLAS